MASSSYLLTFLPLLAWIIYVLYCLTVNFIKAKKTGLPLVILPIDCGNPLWMSIDTRVLPYFRRLPFGTNNFTRFNWRGWEIQDRYRAHQELGDAFIFVTPGKNWLQICNAETISEIFARKAEFTRPTEMLEMLNVFGPNLGTTEGPQWQRHRKITATCFNERNNELVWSESLAQAAGMVHYWSSKRSVNSLANDSRTLSLHVMSSAAFGKSYAFQGAEEVSTTNDLSSIRDSLKLILDNCIPLVALGPSNLNKWWLPKSWKELHQATVTFRTYMTTTYEEEKHAISSGRKGGDNLMTSLVRASQAKSEGFTTNPQQDHGGLTEQEIYGNMFVFNFAGHDTTANSLAFGLVLIATRPDYETVRLYTPVAIVKTTGSEPRSIQIRDKTYTLPADMMIIPSYSALHTHPRHWGNNSLEWEPSRWIISDPAKKASAEDRLESETFFEFPKGANPFVAWSEGARVCPGRKFSQVEFVGVLVALFRQHKIRPVPLDEEDDEAARKRLRRMVQKDAGMKLLLQLMHPEQVILKCEKRV
ncbi:cytochrome P450 monooxygenase-like protein [Mollisia scopiformis]|uniref:Cytochrome P450 monooxygenase-like protein n=1 Tax=Mollisia scopiformis TaxID=149040 RepID=A0A194X739_MOLSC|nr:cytochrome P450 monooxygenase-like protein [Mollisia scopiformis]KUJ15990.1 cytochrome P450 monooxygenase-like protein [Mollisia scopiformis]